MQDPICMFHPFNSVFPLIVSAMKKKHEKEAMEQEA